MTIPNEGPNVSLNWGYDVSIVIELETSETDVKKGASHRPYKAKDASAISAQKGTSKLGAHVVPYRPELMAILAEAK